MFKPVPLQKVYLIGMRSAEAQALRLWQKLGVVHISPLPAGKYGLHEGEVLEDYAQVSEQLVRLRAILSQLPVVDGPAPALTLSALEAARSIHIEPELLKLKEEEESIQKQLSGRREREKSLARLSNISLELSKLPPHLAYSLVSVQTPKLEATLARLRKSLKHAQMLTVQDGVDVGRTLVLIAAPVSADLTSALEGTDRVAIPVDVSGTPKAALLMAQSESEALAERLRTVQRQRHELALRYYPLCKHLEASLSASADLSRISSAYMRQSSSCFFCEGWVRPEKFEALQAETSKALGRQVAVRPVPEEAHHGHGRPTLLQNPKFAGPSQYMVEFLGLPQSDEIDPTLITFVTLPILYGLIMGDAGYALVSFLLAFLMYRSASKGGMLQNFAGLWMLCAIPSFIFGILFDEYFGFSHAAILGTRLYSGLVHRVEDVQGLLVLTIAVGWIHIAFGFLLGALNAWGHNRKHAIAKLAWLPIQIGGTLAAACFLLNALPLEVGLFGVGLLAAGAVVMAWGEGPLGLIEIPGLASNIMSYARIAAVGVAGVILAEAINTLALPNPSMLATPGGILVFLLVAVLYVIAHIFNIAVAMFEGIVHGTRLNVIEFFGKFFKGGGVPFRPLSKDSRMGM